MKYYIIKNHKTVNSIADSYGQMPEFKKAVEAEAELKHGEWVSIDCTDIIIDTFCAFLYKICKIKGKTITVRKKKKSVSAYLMSTQ